MKDTLVLLHVDDSEEVADVINGHLFVLPPGEPVEMDAFFAQAVMEHKGDLHGLVFVDTKKTKTGIEWDVEKAVAEAEKKLIICEDKLVQFYVRQQMEDRIAAGKPAIAPSGRVRNIVARKKISLRDEFGLQPIGWKDPGSDKPYTHATAQTSESSVVATLTQQVQEQRIANEQLQASLSELQEQMAGLMAALATPKETGDTES